MADEQHKHEWEDAWGADCVVCHVDLIGYAESAQERITTLETQYAAAMAIVREVASVPDADYIEECPFCHQMPEIKHMPDCPVTNARALLAEE